MFNLFLACGVVEPTGQIVFAPAEDAAVQIALTFNWVVPSGVTAIHVVAVNASGNRQSSIKRGTATLISGDSTIGSSFGGGNGGASTNTNYRRGGGGAGGYAGNGGNSGSASDTGARFNPSPAATGSGGGGGGFSDAGIGGSSPRAGGVGLQGKGVDGAAAPTGNNFTNPGGNGSDPGPFYGAGVGPNGTGSGEAGGNLRYTVTPLVVTPGETLVITLYSFATLALKETSGAVRIMWGGDRSYPNNAKDV